MHIKSYQAQFKALDEAAEGAGVFEALVAVFNNVDRMGDKILPGAFAKSLGRWKASGDPIPVIYAHEWDNLDAHIGHVLEAKEVDEGLYIKAQLDMDEPFAARVWKKMQRRVLKQFSFAYDVVEGKQMDGVYELHELDLLEVGPCLVGVNPETELISVKDRLAVLKAGARHTAKEYEHIQQIHDLAVELGAKCAEPAEDSDGDGSESKGEAGNGKLSSKRETLAARVAMDLLEMGYEGA